MWVHGAGAKKQGPVERSSGPFCFWSGVEDIPASSTGEKVGVDVATQLDAARLFESEFTARSIMHVNRISFTEEQAGGEGQATDLIEATLATWRSNGQLCGREWPIFRSSGVHVAIALSPEADSLRTEFSGRYVTAALARMETRGIRVTVEHMGEDETSSPSCRCSSRTAYALFTSFVSLESPIRCMDCFLPVALYRLPVMESGEFHELISWQSDYQSCDSLQMNCHVLERAATREISNFSSTLATLGRSHCESLATLTDLPVYYYLYRGHGRSLRSELDRRCPCCDGEWHLPTRLHSLFDFKCDRCHLLSNVAFEFQQ
jgi:predicted  nucleic acid-binding Zn ribbon protein